MKIFNLKVIKKDIINTKLMRIGMNFPLCKTRVDKYEPRHRESISFLYDNNVNLKKNKIRKRKRVRRIKKEEDKI